MSINAKDLFIHAEIINHLPYFSSDSRLALEQELKQLARKEVQMLITNGVKLPIKAAKAAGTEHVVAPFPHYGSSTLTDLCITKNNLRVQLSPWSTIVEFITDAFPDEANHILKNVGKETVVSWINQCALDTPSVWVDVGDSGVIAHVSLTEGIPDIRPLMTTPRKDV